jgi:hypothetical protein
VADGAGGSGVTTDHTTASEPVSLATSHKHLPREALPHSQKFRVALAALSGIAAAAIVIAVVVLVNSNGSSAAQAGHWSSWAPSDDGNTGITQIARHVAAGYLQSESNPLDVVTQLQVSQFNASGTTTGSGPLVVVNAGGKSRASLAPLNGTTIAYNICGRAATRKCELTGKASANRLLLMQREALELALYTFKYIGDSQHVLAVLPPVRAKTKGGGTVPVTVSVLFARKGLQPELDAPLSTSLQTPPPTVPELASWVQTQEAQLVNGITERVLFVAQLENEQVAGKLLILSPLAH